MKLTFKDYLKESVKIQSMWTKKPINHVSAEDEEDLSPSAVNALIKRAGIKATPTTLRRSLKRHKELENWDMVDHVKKRLKDEFGIVAREDEEIDDPNNPFNNYDENQRRGDDVDDFMSSKEEDERDRRYRKSRSNPYGTEGSGYDDYRLDHDEDEEDSHSKYHQHDARGMDPRDDEEYGDDERCWRCNGPTDEGECMDDCTNERDEDEEELEDEDMDDEEFEDEDMDEESDDDEFEDEDGDDEFEDEDGDDEDMDDEEPEDPNMQGVIRTVDDAHLVYKRQDEEGTFEELWMYKVGTDNSDEIDVRRDVLAGTDIPQGSKKSEDGTQKFTLWTSGNVQFLHITGLPN